MDSLVLHIWPLTEEPVEYPYCKKHLGLLGDSKAYYYFYFFARSAHIELDLAQAALLTIFSIGKYVVLHLLEGPELRTHY